MFEIGLSQRSGTDEENNNVWRWDKIKVTPDLLGLAY